jgi:hypothetical protein
LKNIKFSRFIKGFFFFYGIPLLIFSCKPSYQIHKKEYEQAASSINDAAPDYSSLYYWAAHPGKKDPSDSTPSTLLSPKKALLADVFFIHPTTQTDKMTEGVLWNSRLNDADINLKTDYTSMLYQASVFNGSCRVFAPRYRQAHIFSFNTKDTAKALAAFQLAYVDVRAAFLHYLKNENNGRPIIIASHSQGTLHARWLLKEFFDGKELKKQLVCAYLLGLTLPVYEFQDIKVCENENETGCYVGWRTFRKGYVPEYIQREKEANVVVNPLSWTTDTIRKPRSMNEAAILFRFNKPYTKTNGAQISRNVLWIEKPRFPFSFIDRRKNYHAGDINLFYMNIRNNVATRIAEFVAKNPGVE